MQGEPIEAVRQGIKALLMELRSDPQALETAYISVITFSSVATQQCPLTELIAFKEPQIEAGGLTSLGASLELLSECIENEVIKNSSTVKGDWRPLVFILTDGVPTDTWEEQAKKLKSQKPANIIACGAGADANANVLKQITDNVIMLNNLSAGDLSQFFKWVSDSIKLSSNSLDAEPNQPIQLPAPPPTFTIIP
jgi:uncharacterized protein YegL